MKFGCEKLTKRQKPYKQPDLKNYQKYAFFNTLFISALVGSKYKNSPPTKKRPGTIRAVLWRKILRSRPVQTRGRNYQVSLFFAFFNHFHFNHLNFKPRKNSFICPRQLHGPKLDFNVNLLDMRWLFHHFAVNPPLFNVHLTLSKQYLLALQFQSTQ